MGYFCTLNRVVFSELRKNGFLLSYRQKFYMKVIKGMENDVSGFGALQHFTLYTEHQALKWLFDLLEISSVPRLTRWRLCLQELDNFTVRYRRGPDNQVDDAISRLSTYGFE